MSWIKVENLPTEIETVLITVKFKYSTKVLPGFYSHGYWMTTSGTLLESKQVIAWMKLPEPFDK